MKNNKLIRVFQSALAKIDGFHLIQKQWNDSTVSLCYTYMTTIKLFIVFMVLLASRIAMAGDDLARPIDGQLYITNETYEKLKDVEGLQVFLTGETAEYIYGHMKESPQTSKCHSDGTLEKRNGNFVCERWNNGNHVCYFQIDLEKQSMEKTKNC